MGENPMKTSSNGSDDRLERSLLLYLPRQPDLAVQKLHLVSCGEKRMKIAVLIAQIWARADINAAWKAVSQSKLSIKEKQVMFNELWG
jgi:hypothetical protein